MIRGISAVVKNLDKLSKAIEEGGRKGQMRTGLELEREYVSNIDDMGIVDTGRYKDSAGTQEVGDVVEVGSGVKAGSEVDYAHKLEFGSPGRAARPALQVAVETIRQKYPKMVIEDVKAEMK
ncbi:MAG: hypothetical protein U9R05_10090 [Chloroflexota bacterium]|nr:hypothetical protein [Chloroflexota bacterium]